VVDAANVVGSRPDGWWRDRAGAAARLHERLVAVRLPPYDEVVLVVEGAARRGCPEGVHGTVRTAHAAGSGDDAIVEEARLAVAAGREVTVVTADRGLRARLEAVGAAYVGPSWLLERLDG
jgi:hypothetical protein